MAKSIALIFLFNILLVSSVKGVLGYDCFENNTELIAAVDEYVLDPGNATSAVALQYGHPIGTWCVDEVQDFSNVFNGARNNNLETFNEDLSGWNVSSALKMEYMFSYASSFSQDLSAWNTSNVQSTYAMFDDASSFVGDLSTWDTSNVQNMSYMFEDASSFNGDLSQWNVSSVVHMDGMFWAASSFNQDLSTWNTMNVQSMYSVFREISDFNGDLSAWNTSNVQDMYAMFYYSSSFNRDLSAWDTSNVQNMEYMFGHASSFNQDLSAWNTANVESMYAMFYDASSFNQGLSAWNTANVQDMAYMFEDASSFNQDLSAWNTSNVQDMKGMFWGALSFNGYLLTWNTLNVQRMDYMFAQTSFNQDLCNWGPLFQGRNVSVESMFESSGCPNQADPDLDASPPGPFCFECVASMPPSPLPSTATPSQAPTRENQLNVDLVPFFVALQLPDGRPDNEPSQEDFEQLRLQTERFLDQVFRKNYLTEETLGNPDERRRQLQNLEYVYGSVSLITVTTNYRGGVPEEDFNIYAGYDGFVIFYGVNATQNGTQPTDEDLFDLIEGSNTTEYISDYVTSIPSFAGVNNATSGAKADTISFSPTVSFVPTSSPSQLPTVFPSRIPTMVPSPEPSNLPSLHMEPTKEPCPCGRFRLLCRLIRFRLCVPYDA